MRILKTVAVMVALLLVSCGGIAVYWLIYCDGVAFRVLDQCGAPLKNVEIKINETSYAVGDVDVGGHGRVFIRTFPPCSPHLKYDIGDASYDVDVDTYLCNGMQGTISITVNREELVVQAQVDIYSLHHSPPLVRSVPVKPAAPKGG